MARRDVLKALGAGALAASGARILGRDASAAAPELRYPPERHKYGGWYDAVKAYCMTDGRWITLGMAFPTSCVVYRVSMVQAPGFSEIPREVNGFLKLCRALSACGGAGTPVLQSVGYCSPSNHTPSPLNARGPAA